MNLCMYHIILDCLHDLKNGKISHPHAGICYNVYCRLASYDDVLTVEIFLHNAFTEIAGRKLSNDEKDYPIEGSDEKYCTNDHKWDMSTEYGQKRIMYVEKLIQIVERKILEKQNDNTI